MLRWFARILDTGADLLDVKAQLVMRSLERVGITLVGYLGACMLLILGVGALLAATVVALVPSLGVALSLLVVGVGAIVVAAAVMYLCSNRGPLRRKHRDSLDRRSHHVEQSFMDAVRGQSNSEEEKDAPPVREHESEFQRIAGKLTANPVAAASAGFALLSLIGLKRTMRLISASTVVIGLIESFQRDREPGKSVKTDAAYTPRRGRAASSSQNDAAIDALAAARAHNGQRRIEPEPMRTTHF